MPVAFLTPGAVLQVQHSQILCRPEDPTLHIPSPLGAFSRFGMLTYRHTLKENHNCGPCGEYCALLLRLTSATGCMAATPVHSSRGPVSAASRVSSGKSSQGTGASAHSLASSGGVERGVESGGVPWALLGWRFSIYNFPTKNRLPCTPLIVGCSVLDAPEPASLLPKIFC